MKVLMTGMTLQQANRAERVRLSYCSNPTLLARAIRTAGHELDWRPVTPGETFDGYDCMIVGLANMLSFGSRYALGAIWAAGFSNTAYLIDDWNVGAVDGSIKGTARSRVDQALMRPVLPRDNKEVAMKFLPEIYGILEELASGKWRRPTLGSFFSWGDKNLFRTATNVGEIWGFDPSVYQPTYSVGLMNWTEKLPVLTLASLPNHEKWASVVQSRTAWKVRQYGHLKSNQMRLTESEIVRLYASSWGVLSPPYKHAGSGWWRARMKYAMDVGSFLVADPVEVKALGPAFTWPMENLSKLNSLSCSELKEMADAQRATFYDWMWTEEAFVNWADGMVRCLAAGDSTLEKHLEDGEV
jgi:hypothetical protein